MRELNIRPHDNIYIVLSEKGKLYAFYPHTKTVKEFPKLHTRMDDRIEKFCANTYEYNIFVIDGKG